MDINEVDSIRSSTSNIISTSSTGDIWERLQDHTSVEFAFWISIGLLMVVSVLKYVVSHKDTRKDWGQMVIEFPIDLCLVVLTILVTVYLKKNLGGGVVLIVLTIFAIIICCITRRKSLDCSMLTDKFIVSWAMGVITVVVAVILTSLVYSVII